MFPDLVIDKIIYYVTIANTRDNKYHVNKEYIYKIKTNCLDLKIIKPLPLELNGFPVNYFLSTPSATKRYDYLRANAKIYKYKKNKTPHRAKSYIQYAKFFKMGEYNDYCKQCNPLATHFLHHEDDQFACLNYLKCCYGSWTGFGRAKNIQIVDDLM